MLSNKKIPFDFSLCLTVIDYYQIREVNCGLKNSTFVDIYYNELQEAIRHLQSITVYGRFSGNGLTKTATQSKVFGQNHILHIYRLKNVYYQIIYK